LNLPGIVSDPSFFDSGSHAFHSLPVSRDIKISWTEQTRWGLFATVGAMHFWHVDCNGTDTEIRVVKGKKLWFLAIQKDGGTGLSPKRWQTFSPESPLNPALYDIVVLTLGTGDRL
jgi:hypothetical protein